MTLTRIVYTVFASLLLSGTLAAAEDFDWAPQFPVGSQIPLLAAQDHLGAPQTLASLTGEKGLVLFFNRSFDWCPYCKAQLKDLVKQQAAINALGFGVAAMTYDSVATLELIADDEQVGFKLLHDEAAQHVNAFGILNTDYAPGHRAYGVPQPGILVIRPDGTIVQKFAEADYRQRPDFAVVLDALKSL